MCHIGSIAAFVDAANDCMHSRHIVHYLGPCMVKILVPHLATCIGPVRLHIESVHGSSVVEYDCSAFAVAAIVTNADSNRSLNETTLDYDYVDRECVVAIRK